MKEKNVYAHVGELLKEYRIKHKITQLELAKKLNYKIPQFISLMENGHSRIPLNTLGDLVCILKIPEKKILDILVQAYIIEVKEQIAIGKKKIVG